MKIAEEPFKMKPGISSSPTDFESFSFLMALQTFTSETEARDRNSEHCETGKVDRATVIMNWLKVLSESIRNYNGLGHMCIMDI
jgi:hypothetical protein